MYGVYHTDKFTSYLLKLCETFPEAQEYLRANYAHRLATGKDTACIRDSNGNTLEIWGVEWMPQFEAVKSWRFPSSSSSKMYETRLTTTGIISCDCRGWTNWAKKKVGQPRGCWHVDEVIATLSREGMTFRQTAQYWIAEDKKLQAAKQKFAGTATTPQQKFTALVAQYEAAINRMLQLDPKDMLKMAVEVETLKFKLDSYIMLLEEKGLQGVELYEAAQARLGAALQ